MLSFNEKIMALATIRALNLPRAVQLFSHYKSTPITVMRRELDLLDGTHYLLDDGFVEVTSAGVLQFYETTCPQQPQILSKEYFESCKVEKQEALLEAINALKCFGLLRNFKPYAIVRKERVYAKKATAC